MIDANLPTKTKTAIARESVSCNVCGRQGGTGARGKLRVLLRRYAEMKVEPDWADASWEDGYVHSQCYLDQQLALSRH